MNLLAFCAPDRICYLDSCPTGLGCYSNQVFAWRYCIPNKLLFWAMNNLLKYLAAIITPWIDLINGQLHKGDCAFSMTDSLTAKGWMRKTNFIKTGDNAIQAATRVDASQHYAAFSWMATSRATVNGSQGRRTTLRIPSLETGIATTKNSLQFYAIISPRRCPDISLYCRSPARSTHG